MPYTDCTPSGLTFSFTVRTKNNTKYVIILIILMTSPIDQTRLSEVYENIIKCETSNFVPVHCMLHTIFKVKNRKTENRKNQRYSGLLYSPEDNASSTSQTPTTHCTNTCVKLTIVTKLSFSERIAIATLSYYCLCDFGRGWGGGYDGARALHRQGRCRHCLVRATFPTGGVFCIFTLLLYKGVSPS